MSIFVDFCRFLSIFVDFSTRGPIFALVDPFGPLVAPAGSLVGPSRSLADRAARRCRSNSADVALARQSACDNV